MRAGAGRAEWRIRTRRLGPPLRWSEVAAAEGAGAGGESDAAPLSPVTRKPKTYLKLRTQTLPKPYLEGDEAEAAPIARDLVAHHNDVDDCAHGAKVLGEVVRCHLRAEAPQEDLALPGL